MIALQIVVCIVFYFTCEKVKYHLPNRWVARQKQKRNIHKSLSLSIFFSLKNYSCANFICFFPLKTIQVILKEEEEEEEEEGG